MKKNVLIISGTPRKGGNSDVLCDRFAEGAREAGLRVEKICLGEKQIRFCTGCGICYNGEKPCPQQDDVAEILEKMVTADVIVLATPVYFYTMCGQLKTLIDRSCARYTEMADKTFYFILTAADDNLEMMTRTVESIRGFTEDCLEGATEAGIVYGLGVWKIGEIVGNPALDEAYAMGKGIQSE